MTLQRAHILLEQGRYKDAEKEIKSALSIQPDDDEAYGMLARVYLDSGDSKLALDTIVEALRLGPDEAYYLYIKAFAEYKLDQISLAQSTLDKAIAMNPYNPAYFALYAYLLLEQKDFAGALRRADEGLAIDGEDIGCLNARGRALTKMGRTNDAISTMQNSLASDPENDFTHTNVGWNLLEKGQHKQAVTHFKESLRLNPGSDAARDGMKEALKSKIVLYRWFLMYGLWLSNRKQGVRIGMTIGIYLCFRVISSLGKQLQPPFSYIAFSLVALYVLAVISSWLILPIANFCLLFHPQGKYALTPSERINSQTVVGSLLVGLCMFIVAMFTPGDIGNNMILSAGVIASLSFPFSHVHYPVAASTTKSKIALALTAVGLLTAVLLMAVPDTGQQILIAYILALVLSSWVSAFRN